MGSIEKQFNEDKGAIEEAEIKFSGSEHLSNWCQDLEMELGNAGLENMSYNEKRIRYCSEFCTLFPKSDDTIIFNMKRAIAESTFRMGKIEEGEKLFNALVEQYPNDAWAYIGWGDMYWLERSKKIPVNLHKAERIYRMALEHDLDESESVLARLEDLQKRLKQK